MSGGEAAASPGGAAPVLEVIDLHKEFKVGLRLKRVHAVRGISFQVAPGEIFGFLGPNGAGKTTTMKVAMGLIGATRGEVRMFGRSIEDQEVRRRVGYMPEHPYFYDYLTPEEILDFFGQLFEIPRDVRAERIDRLIRQVGLDHARDRTLRRFSKGMLQRVGLAQALINDPDLVVFDEPLSGLDPMGRKEVRDIIVSLREQGKTVFFSSHILHDIETICDRVAILIQGRVERLAPLEELLGKGSQRVDVVATGVDEALEARLVELGALTSHVGRSVSVSVDEGGVDEVLRAILDGGGRVTHLNPRRETLEDLFVREAGGAS